MLKSETNARLYHAVLQSHCLVLTLVQKQGHISEFEITDDEEAGKTVLNLTGRLIKCGVLSPRLEVQLKDLVNDGIICSYPVRLVSLY